MHIAEGQHDIGGTVGTEVGCLRIELDDLRGLVVGRIRRKLCAESLVVLLVVLGAFAVGDRRDVAALAPQIGRKDLGVPAAARGDFDHRVRCLQAEEFQGLLGMPILVACLVVGRAPITGDGGIQRIGHGFDGRRWRDHFSGLVRGGFRRSRCFGFLATGRQDEGEACGEREDFHGDLQGVTTFAGVI